MNLILLGTPGAGKGTQAKLLAKHFSLKHISSGELLRNLSRQDTPKGKLVKEIMDKGELVPFDTVLDVVLEDIKASQGGFILDGTPRNLSQAKHMDWFFSNNNINTDIILNYSLDDQTALERLASRSQQENRSDDTRSTHLNRLEIYHKESKPVIDYYLAQEKLITVDAKPDIQTIFANTLEALKKAQVLK